MTNYQYPSKKMTRLFDINELSRLLGMPVIQLAALCRNEMLPHVVISGGYWFILSELAGAVNIKEIK